MAKIFVLLLLVVAGLSVAWVMSRNSSNEKFNDYVANMTSDGQPLAVDEVVNRSWSLPPGGLDTTAEWEAAIEQFSRDKYRNRIKNMKLVGDQSTLMWPPRKWRDFDMAALLVSDYRKDLIGLQLATNGFGILETDYNANPNLTEEEMDALWRTFDFLELSCYVAAHERKQDEIVGRLLACLTFSNCLLRHPGHIADRAAFDVRAYNVLIRAVGKVRFDESELRKFRDLILEKDYWQPIRDYWDYQRAVRLLMYSDLEAFQASATYREMQNDPAYADFVKDLEANLVYSPFSGEDGIQFLELMKSLDDSFQGNPVNAIAAITARETTNSQAPEGMDQYRYPTARRMLPSMVPVVESTVEAQVYQQVALAMLAADHTRVTQDRLPESLDEAIAGFLEESPMDWYVDRPVKMVRTGEQVQVFSVGPDGKDNKLGQDDIGAALPLEKWDADIGNLNRID